MITVGLEEVLQRISHEKPSILYGDIYKTVHGVGNAESTIGAYIELLTVKLLEEAFCLVLGERRESLNPETVIDYLTRIPSEVGIDIFTGRKEAYGTSRFENMVDSVLNLSNVKEVDSPKYEAAKSSYLNLFTGEDHQRNSAIVEELESVGRLRRSFALLVSGYFNALQVPDEWKKFHRDDYIPAEGELDEFVKWLRENRDDRKIEITDVLRSKAERIVKRFEALNEVYGNGVDLGEGVRIGREILFSYLDSAFASKDA